MPALKSAKGWTSTDSKPHSGDSRVAPIAVDHRRRGNLFRGDGSHTADLSLVNRAHPQWRIGVGELLAILSKDLPHRWGSRIAFAGAMSVCACPQSSPRLAVRARLIDRTRAVSLRHPTIAQEKHEGDARQEDQHHPVIHHDVDHDDSFARRAFNPALPRIRGRTRIVSRYISLLDSLSLSAQTEFSSFLSLHIVCGLWEARPLAL